MQPTFVGVLFPWKRVTVQCERSGESLPLSGPLVINLRHVTKSRKETRFRIRRWALVLALPLLIRKPLACHSTPLSHSVVIYKTGNNNILFVA